MCLIIRRKKGDVLTEDFFDDVYSSNPHGWGVLYRQRCDVTNEVKVVAKKGIKYKKFKRLYRNLQKHDVACVIHFRYATSGAREADNSHPFEILPGLFFMHNGIINIKANEKEKDDAFVKTLSDTQLFVRDVLKPMLLLTNDPTHFIRQDFFKHMLEAHASKNNSRYVMYDKDGAQFYGTWHKTTKGVIVSNTYAFDVDNPTKSYKSYDNFGGRKWNRAGYYEDGGYYGSGSYSSTNKTPTVIGKPNAIDFDQNQKDLDKFLQDRAPFNASNSSNGNAAPPTGKLDTTPASSRTPVQEVLSLPSPEDGQDVRRDTPVFDEAQYQQDLEDFEAIATEMFGLDDAETAFVSMMCMQGIWQLELNREAVQKTRLVDLFEGHEIYMPDEVAELYLDYCQEQDEIEEDIEETADRVAEAEEAEAEFLDTQFQRKMALNA